MTELFACTFPTPSGPAALAHGPEGLVAVVLPAQTEAATVRGLEAAVSRRKLSPDAEVRVRWVDAPRGEMAEAVEAVRAHLAGLPASLESLRLDLRGMTPFTVLVYEEARRIPKGDVCTYGELAARVGRPAAARAVGGAMAHNPFLLVVPCHRVVGSHGDLHGFSAPGGVRTKAALLALEGRSPGSLEAPSAPATKVDRQPGLPFDGT